MPLTPPVERTFFDNEVFQNSLTSLLLHDVTALRQCYPVLKAEDFKPLRGSIWGRPRWIVAERALHFYQKYTNPIGKMIMADVLDYSKAIALPERQVAEVREYIDHLRTIKIPAPDSIVEKVVRFKRERIQAAALQELNELQASGLLTDEKWSEVYQRVISSKTSEKLSEDYLNTLPDRLARRRGNQLQPAIPLTLIDPLDSIVHQFVGYRELGLILAPFKRGKSLMLQWFAVAFCLQRLDVLFITLENPRRTVEDRLDSITTGVPIANLSEKPNTITRQFNRWKSMVSARINIYDGVGEGMTVADVERLLLQERNRGFRPQVLIIDYDDKLVPARRQKDKRFEIEDIYNDLLNLAAKYNLILWTAAQTQRNTSHLKILSGDHTADDIGKIRNCTMALSMGKGDWTDNSLFLWVAAHRNAEQEIGCEIIPDLKHMLIYSREDTYRATLEHQEAA